MTMRRNFGLLIVTLFLVAGCDAFPGLNALNGDATAAGDAEAAVQTMDLIMADKSGNVNVSLLLAADRLEAAAGNVDVVEIREDLVDDTFLVYMIVDLDDSSPVAQVDSIRRVLELTWLATMRESQRSGLLRVEFLAPSLVSTLDNGISYLGFTQILFEIDRPTAIQYLAQPHDLNAFQDLILDGRLVYDQPDQDIYLGEPNHPVFMLRGTQ